MPKYSEKYLDYTIEVWQSHFSERLTREQARQIADNVLGFYSVLLKSEQEYAKVNEVKNIEK